MALLAGAFAASPANAQNVSYSTSGTFSGSACTALSCNIGGFVLTFDPIASSLNNAPNTGGTITLGDFLLTGPTTTGTTTGTVSGSQAMFSLAINQSSPTSGTGFAMGSITGTVQGGVGGNFSTLVFAPNQTVTIGSTTYNLIFDTGTNGIRIAYQGADAANTTSVKATLTQTAAVPEPASVILLGTGLVGIFGAARRRQKNAR